VGTLSCDPDYFSLNVKTQRKDLYDREEELAFLEKSVELPITVVTGIRRVGKSSVVSVFLSDKPGMLVDLRETGPNPSARELFKRFEKALNSSRIKRLWQFLSERIRGISVGPFGVVFERGVEQSMTLSALFDLFEDYASSERVVFTIALDEVQEARGYKRLQAAIAHSYDYNKHVRFVLTGSQVGLLEDFLGERDPSAYLFGRAVSRVEVKRLSKERSLDFLNKGFYACGVDPPKELEKVVEALDGIVGWLAHYGNYKLKGLSTKEIIKNAAMLELEEVKKLRGKYYLPILQSLAQGSASWSYIFRFVRANVDTSERQFNEALKQLVKYGFVEKNKEGYSIADPVLRLAVSKTWKNFEDW
jgi:AAA+ ATPase superfamily predicted ATPase